MLRTEWHVWRVFKCYGAADRQAAGRSKAASGHDHYTIGMQQAGSMRPRPLYYRGATGRQPAVIFSCGSFIQQEGRS